MSSIEVERNFTPTNEFRQTFAQWSGRAISLEDAYYGEQLAVEDRWLRLRNGDWEMKVPVQVRLEEKAGATVYRELAGKQVLQEVKEGGFNLANLSCFARVHTNRTLHTMSWRDFKVNLVLDECSSNDGFRYELGEIEILVDQTAKVAAANHAIEEVAEHFKLNLVHDSEGKLMRYLREMRPSLFRKLQGSSSTGAPA